MSLLHVIGKAFRLGARDYTAIFTWKTWLSNWLVRVVAQVSFFALVGRMLGTEAQTGFLLVGNSVMLAAMLGMWAVNMVNIERQAGTLPLLLASPTRPCAVLAARGAYLIVDGTLSASAALLITGLCFGIPMPLPRLAVALALIPLVAASSFCFGTLAGSLLLGFRSIESIVTNVGVVLLMTLCGVNVPVDFYPPPLRWLSEILPVTHGLIAVRLAFAGDFPAVLWPACQEAIVGAAWLTVCLTSFTALARRARRLGTLNLSS